MATCSAHMRNCSRCKVRVLRLLRVKTWPLVACFAPSTKTVPRKPLLKCASTAPFISSGFRKICLSPTAPHPSLPSRGF